MLFVGGGEAPEITRYDVQDGGCLVDRGTIDFGFYGLQTRRSTSTPSRREHRLHAARYDEAGNLDATGVQAARDRGRRRDRRESATACR